MNAEKIIETLNEKITPSEFAYGDYDQDELGLGETEIVDDISKTDGYAHVVVHFTEHNIYIKLEGWYNSYNGSTEYDEPDYSEVKPVVKEVTFYE
jgi:hypothetical protein